MPASRLYRADTGALISTISLGDGLRQKAFLDEISQMCMEAAVSPGLGVRGPLSGYTREANFPTFVDGSGLSSNPIGQAPVIPVYNGVTVFKASSNTFVFAAVGAATLGAVGPTQDDPLHANYGGAGAGDNYVATPQGATAAARVTSGAGPYNCTAPANILNVIVNGVSYSVTITDVVSGAGMAAVTVADICASINNAGIPGIYAVLTTAGPAARILTQQLGRWNTLNIVNNFAGAVIFAASAALGATVQGAGGPLNEVARQSTGFKTQRRILPQSILLTTTVGGNAITVTDNGLGVLAGNNGLGQTCLGTINYVTGAITVTYNGVTTAAVNITYKSLTPLELDRPVRVPRNGLDLAILNI